MHSQAGNVALVHEQSRANRKREREIHPLSQSIVRLSKRYSLTRIPQNKLQTSGAKQKEYIPARRPTMPVLRYNKRKDNDRPHNTKITRWKGELGELNDCLLQLQ